MNSRGLGATRVLAWQGSEVAVMGAVAAVRLLHRRELAAASDEERPALEARLVADHEQRAGGVLRAQEIGVVDETIDPGDTRGALGRALAGALPVRGQHGDISLCPGRRAPTTREESDERRHTGSRLRHPAIVQEVVVTTGSRMSSGDTLVVLEAMKMEIPVFAEADALVEEVHVQVGEPVREGQAVVTLAT